jgi:hypothetical protein
MTSEELEKRIQNLEALENKIQVLGDIEEIKNLHRNYVSWLCLKQWDKMLDCFSQNAVADIQGETFRKGKTEIADLFYNVMEKKINRNDAHILSQPIISVEGKKARGYWTLHILFSGPDGRWVQGRQECDYIKVKGQWKYSSMKFVFPWPVPSDEG